MSLIVHSRKKVRKDPSRCLNVRLGNWPRGRGLSKEEKLRTRLLLKEPARGEAAGIVKGFEKEDKAACQASVSILVGEHSQVLEAIPHCHRAHLEFFGQNFDCFTVI